MGPVGGANAATRWPALLWALFGLAACSASGSEPLSPSSHDGPQATSEPSEAPTASSASPTEAGASDMTGVANGEDGPASGAPAAPSSSAPPAAGTAPNAAAESETAETPCTDRPELEAPVHEGKMGQGDRLIRVLNRTGGPVRLRLLDDGDKPALDGTLHIPKAGAGELHVEAGSYRVRYRLETSCEVLRGSPIVLTGNRAGVEIQLRSGGAGPGSGSVQHVGGAL